MSIVSDVAWDHYEVHHAVYRAKRHRRSQSNASHSSAEGQSPVDRSWSMEPNLSPASRQVSSASVSPEGSAPVRDGSDDSDEPKGFYETAPDLSEVVSAQASALAWADSTSHEGSSSDGEGGGTGASALSVASAPDNFHGFHGQRRTSSSGASDMSAILRFASAVSAEEIHSLEDDIQTALAEEGVRLPVTPGTSEEGSISSPTGTTTNPSLDLSSPRFQNERRQPLSRRPSSRSSLRSQSWQSEDGSRSA